MRGTDLVIEITVQALAIGGFAVRKGILAHLFQCVPIGKSGLAKDSKLLRGRIQFEFGRNGGVHIYLFCFHSQKTAGSGVGIRTA